MGYSSSNKKYLSLALFIVFMACSENKHAKLEKLKTEREALNAEILALEKEIGAGNTAEVKVKNVTVATIQPQTFEHFIEIQGRVDADENLSISSKIPGTITNIYVNTGDEVRPGQILAEMDNQQIALGINEVKSQLAFATNVYEKQKNLWDKKIGTEIQFLTAKNNKESLENRLRSLGEQYDMTRIKSPIAGTVDEVNVKIGQAIAPGMPAFRIVNFANLKAVAEVAESYISKIHQGNDVVVYFPDIEKQAVSKISFAGKAINQQNRTFPVQVNLSKSELYHPNMIAILKVRDYVSEPAIVVPVNVIKNSEKGNYVFVAVQEKGKLIAKKQYVVPGQTYAGKTEILSGLKAGDIIITSGYQDMNEGEVIYAVK